MKRKGIWMKTKLFSSVLAILVFAFSFPAQAQQTKKIPLLGYLTNDSISADLPRRDAFKQGLHDLGYREGQNIAVEYRAAEGDVTKFPEFVAELRRLKVDLIFAFTAAAVQAAKKEMPTVPIVSITPDPVASGLVASLAHPGGTITGLSTLAGTEIYGKYVELIKETVPRLSRVGFVYNSTNPFSPLALKETEAAARAFKMSFMSFDARAPEQLDAVFAAAKKQRVGALVIMQDAMILAQRNRVAALAVKSRLPALYGITEHVDAGGLMAYAANRPDIFRRAATYVDKILKGATAGDLPIEQPIKFEFVVNLIAAKQIGLTVPPNVLVRAQRVIR